MLPDELELDHLGAWLLGQGFSVNIAPDDLGGRPFRVYRESRCVGQGATLSEALREATSTG